MCRLAAETGGDVDAVRCRTRPGEEIRLLVAKDLISCGRVSVPT
jgi:hypothetical protein